MPRSLIAPQAAQPMRSASRTRVHLVRHGEVHNPAKVLYGRLPGYHLSDLGRQMAGLVAEHLAHADIAYVAASPLERAQETAAPIASMHGLAAVIEPKVIEAESRLQGEKVGKEMAAPRHWWKYRNPHRPSWGEPYEQIATRMLAAVQLARHAAAGREAVLVSHQMPIWVARLRAEGRPLMHDPRRRECSVASVTTFELVGDDIVGISYAEPARALYPAGADAGSPISAGGNPSEGPSATPAPDDGARP